MGVSVLRISQTNVGFIIIIFSCRIFELKRRFSVSSDLIFLAGAFGHYLATRLWNIWIKLTHCCAACKAQKALSESRRRMFAQRTHAGLDLRGPSGGEHFPCCLLRALLRLHTPIGRLCKMWANSKWCSNYLHLNIDLFIYAYFIMLPLSLPATS